QVIDVDVEAAAPAKALDERPELLRLELPRAAAARAQEVAVDRRPGRVGLLAAAGPVAVADDAQLLEHVQGPVHRRRRGRWIDRPAAIDQLGAGHVALDAGEDVDQHATLVRPAQAPGPELPGHRRPAAPTGAA